MVQYAGNVIYAAQFHTSKIAVQTKQFIPVPEVVDKVDGEDEEYLMLDF